MKNLSAYLRQEVTNRPHAIQLAHGQLMHAVNDRFQHGTSKVQSIANPKGRHDQVSGTAPLTPACANE
jgi:hypothetical protein